MERNFNQSLLDAYILNPRNSEACCNLGSEYFGLNQYSSAICYYQKAIEFANESDYDYRYALLLKLAECYEILGNRPTTVTRFAKYAKTVKPDDPVAYYIIAKIKMNELYRRNAYEQWEWVEVYENAKIGSIYATTQNSYTNAYYSDYNKDKLISIYMISMLRMNMITELKDFMKTWKPEDKNCPDALEVSRYINNVFKTQDPLTKYSKSNAKEWVVTELPNIESNYSQAFQDIFALLMSDHKTYLEIGAAEPVYNNNTKLLELNGFTGRSIEFNNDLVIEFNKLRKNKCDCEDALKIDYVKYIKDNYDTDHIGYLSLDIDPPTNTLECLYNLPLDRVIFDCITIEHDQYYQGEDVKNQMFNILSYYGYIRIVNGVKYNRTNQFEDWYIHKSILDTKKGLAHLIASKNIMARDIFMTYL